MKLNELIGMLEHTKMHRFYDSVCFLCPFHVEKTPSMTVRDGKYHCFGCGKSGDADDLEVFGVNQE